MFILQLSVLHLCSFETGFKYYSGVSYSINVFIALTVYIYDKAEVTITSPMFAQCLWNNVWYVMAFVWRLLFVIKYNYCKWFPMDYLMCGIWYSMKRSAWWASVNCLMFDKHAYDELPKVLCSKDCLMFDSTIYKRTEN